MGDPDSSVSEVTSYIVGKIIKSIFTSNKCHLCSISEQEVMDILVKGVQAVMELHWIKNKTQVLHKCNLSHARHFINSHPSWRLITTINTSCNLHL
jgi:hypothetical protein